MVIFMENNTTLLYKEIDGKRVFDNVSKKVRFNGTILYVPTETTRQLSKDVENVINVDGNLYTIVYSKSSKMFVCDNAKTESVSTLKVFRPSKCSYIQLTEKADKELEDLKRITYRYKGKDYVITLDENGNVKASGEMKNVIAVFTN